MGPNSNSPASAAHPPQSGRKGSKKVRTGCITCKIRKVKCDEAKPFCTRCTRTGRRCDGYLDAKTVAQRQRRSAGPPTVTCDWASSDERRAFHFFQHITAPCLSGDLDGAFWRVLVLQICQSEPAVRHAVLAISSLHEGMVRATTAVTPCANAEERSSFVLYQYNRAIACLLDRMRTADTRPLIPLLTCVLFVCIELMQSKDRESLLHLEQGRKLLSQLGRSAHPRCPELGLIKQHLVPMYTRLNLTSLMFGGEPVEIPAPLKTLTDVPMVFETIDQVRYALYDVMDECLRFAKRTRVAKLGGGVSPDTMQAFGEQQDYLLRKLARFNVAFSLYRSAKPRDDPPGSVSLMQIHAHTTFIWVSTALSQHETAFDDYVDTFSAIIPLATDFINSLSTHPRNQEAGLPAPSGADTRRFAAMFAFEMYIIAPLYFVAAKCRHPVIRRAALELLRRNPARRENLWRANVMAAIAERTMRLEEKHLRPASQPRSRQPSPPELSGLIPDPSAIGQDPWGASFPDATFAHVLAPTVAPAYDSFDTAQPHVASPCSSSAVTSGSAASAGDVGGHTAIGPALLFDLGEASTAHSLSVTPSISSLDDVATPYLGASLAAADTELWSTTATSLPAPGNALELHTPLGDGSAAMSLLSHSQGQYPGSHSGLHAPLLACEGSPPGNPLEMDVAVGGQRSARQHMSAMRSSSSSSSSMTGGSHRYQHQHPHQQQHQLAYQHEHQQHYYHQQHHQQFPRLHVGQMSPSIGSRSPDAPFDVPERFRVRESIIGPDKEDGTSWVMLFRKLGGPEAEWDVLTEDVAVS